MMQQNGSGGQYPELLQHAQVVPHCPMFRQLAVFDAEPVRLPDANTLPRRCYVHQLALVCARHGAQYRHRLPVCCCVFDLEVVIGEDREEPLPDMPGAAVAVFFGGGSAVDVVRRDEVVYGVEVVPVPYLLDVT